MTRRPPDRGMHPPGRGRPRRGFGISHHVTAARIEPTSPTAPTSCPFEGCASRADEIGGHVRSRGEGPRNRPHHSVGAPPSSAGPHGSGSCHPAALTVPLPASGTDHRSDPPAAVTVPVLGIRWGAIPPSGGPHRSRPCHPIGAPIPSSGGRHPSLPRHPVGVTDPVSRRGHRPRRQGRGRPFRGGPPAPPVAPTPSWTPPPPWPVPDTRGTPPF